MKVAQFNLEERYERSRLICMNLNMTEASAFFDVLIHCLKCSTLTMFAGQWLLYAMLY